VQRDRGKRVAVDLFFRTLADSHGAHSAAIVLSGADGDGAIGIKRIKERGGLTIAQDPDEAEHSSTPRSAIATGIVDWVSKVAQMPGRLLEYRQNERRLKLPPEEGPQPAQTTRPAADEDEAALREVLTFLRTRTGRDFSYYKRATIVRRISRRLQVNGLLVVLEAQEPPPTGSGLEQRGAPSPVTEHLERELEQVKAHLRETIEQYEAGTEELKAATKSSRR